MHRQLSLALALVTAGLAATATQASAQQTTTPTATAAKPDSGRWSTNPAERLLAKKTDLSLTDAQIKKLEDLKTKFASKTTPADTGRAAFKTRRAEMKEAMGVLTDAQKKKLDSMRAERHAGWKAKHDSLHSSHQGATAAPDSAKH